MAFFSSKFSCERQYFLGNNAAEQQIFLGNYAAAAKFPSSKISCDTGNVSHLKNHLHSKHKNISIELGILERRRVRNNNHNEDNGEENAAFLSRKKVKYDFDINDTVRDFIKSILMRNLPMTVADNIGKNEMIRKAIQAFGAIWNRQKAKEFILKAADQIYEIIAKDIENVYSSLMFDSASRLNKNVFSGSIRYTKGGK